MADARPLAQEVGEAYGVSGAHAEPYDDAAVSVETEVVGEEEAMEVDVEQRRAERRRSRRAKLSQYFEEEYSSVVGALEIKVRARVRARARGSF